MKLYDELADWWPLLSAPGDYAEEAATFRSHFLQYGESPALSMLELGSGGGNNASYLKATFQMTLVDPSDGMLRVSRALNPECEHVQGDMRNVRLGREFDRVFVHDAVCYMTTLEELRSAMETAYVHCRPGGAVIFVPDHLKENFSPGTDCGGNDDGKRGLRYVEWTHDPDPLDCSYLVDYAYLMRDPDGTIHVAHDRHVEGLFHRGDWLRLLGEVGFDALALPWEHSEVEPGTAEMFIAIRPPRPS